jgi:hypothetical protein
LYHPLQQRDSEPLLGTIEGIHQGEKKIPETQNPVSPLDRFKKPDFRFLETRALQSTPNPLTSRNKCTNQDFRTKTQRPISKEELQEPKQEETNKRDTKGPAL